MLLAVPTAPKTAIAKVTFSLVNNSCMKLKIACIIQPLFFWYLKNYNTKRGDNKDDNCIGYLHGIRDNCIDCGVYRNRN